MFGTKCRSLYHYFLFCCLSVLIVESLSKKRETPLHFACFHGNVAMVNSLLENGCLLSNFAEDEEGFSPIEIACKLGHRGVVEYFFLKLELRFIQEFDLFPLRISVEYGQFEIAQFLLTKVYPPHVSEDAAQIAFFLVLGKWSSFHPTAKPLQMLEFLLKRHVGVNYRAGFDSVHQCFV
eukprot:GCRY01004463.1.p1 GENE.GCRY01004463.1~~GCRY01004463.1.p1  ORF type:complete len:179 (-),score=21.08 GCRY01004463.1:9-545(-)